MPVVPVYVLLHIFVAYVSGLILTITEDIFKEGYIESTAMEIGDSNDLDKKASTTVNDDNNYENTKIEATNAILSNKKNIKAYWELSECEQKLGNFDIALNVLHTCLSCCWNFL